MEKKRGARSKTSSESAGTFSPGAAQKALKEQGGSDRSALPPG